MHFKHTNDSTHEKNTKITAEFAKKLILFKQVHELTNWTKPQTVKTRGIKAAAELRD